MFLIKSSQKRSFFVIFWIEKNTFQTRKEKFEKVPKNRQFPIFKRLVHSFCPIIELFIICVFLGKSSQRRSFFVIYWIQKRMLFRPEKKEVLKVSKKSTFSKGVSLSNAETAPLNCLTLPKKPLQVSISGYLYTAISRKVVGKSTRDNPERYCGWF